MEFTSLSGFDLVNSLRSTRMSVCVCVEGEIYQGGGCGCVEGEIYQGGGCVCVEGEIYQDGGCVRVCLCMFTCAHACTCAAGLCGVVKNSYVFSLAVHCLCLVPM